MLRRLLTVTAALAMVTVPGVASAEPKDSCKDGGFANYVDPTTGQPFTNPGQCIKFVKGGGVLDPLPVAPQVHWIDPYGGEPTEFDGYSVGYRVDGLPAGTPIHLSWTYGGLGVTYTHDAVINEEVDHYSSGFTSLCVWPITSFSVTANDLTTTVTPPSPSHCG